MGLNVVGNGAGTGKVDKMDMNQGGIPVPAHLNNTRKIHFSL